MRYPEYNCPECGHRLFGHVDGGVFCPECGYYFDSDDEDDGDGEDEPATEAPRESDDSEQPASQES